MVQERELSAKRAADQRLVTVEQLRRELTANLEPIKLREINRLIRTSNQAQDSGSPAVVFTATLEGDRLVLPWEVPTPTVSAEFMRHRQEGDATNSSSKDNAAAASDYRLGLAFSRSASESAEARFLLVRVLSKTGNTEEASQLYRGLLNDTSGARDEQGVGLRFFAAE
jgi:hypothetical protein